MATDRLGPIIETAFNQLTSLAAQSGYFASVQSHEPKSAPSTGLTFACWLAPIKPIPERSGLPVTSARLLVMTRIYSSMLADPQDNIDIDLGRAASYMLAQLTGDFEVTGAYIDLLGSYGVDLSADPGYIALDKTMFRVIDMMVPLICDDVYDQVR